MTPHNWKQLSNHPSYTDVPYNTEDGKQMFISVYPYECIRCKKRIDACEIKATNSMYINNFELADDCDLCLIKLVIES